MTCFLEHIRETQLRAFYKTTEEIQLLFAKQQEQLKSMQRTLEDEENYDNTSVDIDLNVANWKRNVASSGERDATGCRSNSTCKARSANSAQEFDRKQSETSSEGASVTEKHDCDIRTQEDQNTQEVEFTGAGLGAKDGFGSDIDGVGTAPVLEGDTVGTERVLETESPGNDVGERNIDLNKCDNLAGETMQVDDETQAQDVNERAQSSCQEIMHQPELDTPQAMEDTEAGGTIRTSDLLASEVAGSWANSTAPSIHGENESPRSRGNDEEGPEPVPDSNTQVDESQNTPYSGAVFIRRKREHQALTEMIGIIAPDLKDQFGGTFGDSEQKRRSRESASDSDTEGCSDSESHNESDAKGGIHSDADTDDGAQKPVDAMEEDDEATQADSVG